MEALDSFRFGRGELGRDLKSTTDFELLKVQQIVSEYCRGDLLADTEPGPKPAGFFFALNVRFGQ